LLPKETFRNLGDVVGVVMMETETSNPMNVKSLSNGLVGILEYLHKQAAGD
jgi:hypothetical protein